MTDVSNVWNIWNTTSLIYSSSSFPNPLTKNTSEALQQSLRWFHMPYEPCSKGRVFLKALRECLRRSASGLLMCPHEPMVNCLREVLIASHLLRINNWVLKVAHMCPSRNFTQTWDLKPGCSGYAHGPMISGTLHIFRTHPWNLQKWKVIFSPELLTAFSMEVS
jgi:hypothetical protein